MATYYTINELLPLDFTGTTGIASLLGHNEVAGQTPWEIFGVSNATLNVLYGLDNGERCLLPAIDTADKLEIVCDHIYKKNKFNWTNMANAMIIEYDKLGGYDLTETESINNDNTNNLTITKGTTITDSKTANNTNTHHDTGTLETVVDGATTNTGTVGNVTGTDVINTVVVDGGSTSEKAETGTYTDTVVRTSPERGYKTVVENEVAGFNSTGYSPKDKSTSTTTGGYTDTTTHTPTNRKDTVTNTEDSRTTTTNATDVTSTNTQNLTENVDTTNTETHNLTTTDTTVVDEDNTSAITGTDTQNTIGTNDTTRTLTRKGSIGVQTYQAQIREERELSIAYDFIDIIIKDINKDLTLPIWGCII